MPLGLDLYQKCFGKDVLEDLDLRDEIEKILNEKLTNKELRNLQEAVMTDVKERLVAML